MIRALALMLMLAGPAAAQSVSLEELRAQVAAEADELAGFRDLLTNPDPNQAIAAMRVMMASGDPILHNLALEAGLSSGNGVMRKVALEAFMATAPTLQAEATLEQIENADTAKFQSFMETNGALSGETTGKLTIEVGPPIEDEGCYRRPRSPCSVWYTGDGISFTMARNRGALRLDEGGMLVGSFGGLGVSGGPVALRIPLLGNSPAQ